MTIKRKLGKEERFLMSLIKGRTYSRKQAKHIFGLGNPSATVLRFISRFDIIVKREYKTIASRKAGKHDIRIVKYSVV